MLCYGHRGRDFIFYHFFGGARTTNPSLIMLLAALASSPFAFSAPLSAPVGDKVTSLPGFNISAVGFDVYSGYLTVYADLARTQG